MTALTALDLASELQALTGKSFIVIEACNSGGGQRWSQAFPSLTQDQINALDEPVAIRFASEAEAREAFTVICRDVANNNGRLITGAVTLITSDWDSPKSDADTRTLSYEIGDEDIPVFDGLTLTYQTVFVI